MGDHPDNALLVACAAQAAERVAEAISQDLANTIWAFAKLQVNPGDALLRACEAAAVRRAVDFNPQEVVRHAHVFIRTVGQKGRLLHQCSAIPRRQPHVLS